jgi:hypothetical protein
MCRIWLLYHVQQAYDTISALRGPESVGNKIGLEGNSLCVVREWNEAQLRTRPYLLSCLGTQLWLKRVMQCRALTLMSRPRGKCKLGVYGDKVLTRTLGHKRDKVTRKWTRLDNEELCNSNLKRTPSCERVNVISRADLPRHLSGFPSFMVAGEGITRLILKWLFSCQCS